MRCLGCGKGALSEDFLLCVSMWSVRTASFTTHNRCKVLQSEIDCKCLQNTVSCPMALIILIYKSRTQNKKYKQSMKAVALRQDRARISKEEAAVCQYQSNY